MRVDEQQIMLFEFFKLVLFVCYGCRFESSCSGKQVDDLPPVPSSDIGSRKF